MSGTELGHEAFCLRACYAMSSTDLVYGGTEKLSQKEVDVLLREEAQCTLLPGARGRIDVCPPLYPCARTAIALWFALRLERDFAGHPTLPAYAPATQYPVLTYAHFTTRLQGRDHATTTGALRAPARGPNRRVLRGARSESAGGRRRNRDGPRAAAHAVPIRPR
eukprot:2288597-Rhodomonas_salina.1